MAKEMILIVLVIFILVESILSNIHPSRKTKFGEIQGKFIEIRSRTENFTVAAYLGVPYAQPPIGDSRRFKNPKPWKKHWRTTRSAVEDGSMCPQLNEENKVIGNEDCLFLNIFVPGEAKKNSDTKYPVLVFVHGGDFKRGSNNSTYYSPDYLLYNETILVTVNYRLGALGFLSTGDNVASGNWGLKDIKMALQWIQENINAFDGDANSVTLWGHDSGAILVHILALSNTTEGLFHKYITSGGSSLAFYAVQTAENARLLAMEAAYEADCITHEQMGKIMKCLSPVEENSTLTQIKISQADCTANENTETLLNCMKNLTTDEITRLQPSLRDIVFLSYGFTPTIEYDSEDAILNANPMTLIKKKRFRDIPWIAGLTKDEGLQASLGILSNDDKNSESIRSWEYYLNSLMELNWSLEDDISVEEVIASFYHIENITMTYQSNITKMIGDAFYNWPVYKAVKLQSELMESSVYFYVLGYQGTFSGTYAIDTAKVYGVSHGDDINYLYPYLNNVFSNLLLFNTGDDLTMIHVMREMWISFVKTGAPQAYMTPSWTQFQINESYAQLGWEKSTNVTIESNFLPERMAFWDNLMNNLSLPIYMEEEEEEDASGNAVVLMRTMIIYYLSFFTLWFVL